VATAFVPGKINVVHGAKAGRTEKFAARELADEIRSVTGKRPKVVSEKGLSRRTASGKLLFILGTRQGSELVARLASNGKCKAPTASQGYAIRTIHNPLAPTGVAIVIAGGDERGVLYGVRDMQHYFLEHVRGRIVGSKLDVRSAPKIPGRAASSWDFYVTDPFGYVDQMSQWKLNAFLVCPWRYLYDHDGIIPYAHERGVDVAWGDGLYSYHYVWGGNHNQWAILPEVAPKNIKRAPNGRCLCPSDPKTIPWMTKYALEVIEKLPGLDAVGFQSGNLDKHVCDCARCKKLSDAEYFVKEMNPVLKAIADTYPHLSVGYGLGGGMIRSKDYARWIPKMDKRASVTIETRYPMPDAEDMDIMDKLAPGNYGLQGKLYGSRGQLRGWRERRNEMFEDLYECVAEAARRGVQGIGALVQTPLYHNTPLYLVNMYAEALWHGGAPPASHRKRIRELCDLDQRVSDPPQQMARDRDKGTVWVIKYPNATLEDRWVPWPVVPNTLNISDLLSGEESATYRFKMPRGWEKGLRSVELVIKGAKDDIDRLKSEYKFDIEINGHIKRAIKCPWKKGGDVHNNRYDNATEWRIPVPRKWLGKETELTLRFRDANGMVMYDRIAFGLKYDQV